MNIFSKSTRKRLYSKLSEKQDLRKVAKSIDIFLTTPDEVENYVQSNTSDNCIDHYNVEILNLFDPELQPINTKPKIKSKLKELLSEAILILDYKKRNDFKIFHLKTKLIATDSDIDEEFKSMHQSIMTNNKKNYHCKDLIVLDVIIVTQYYEF